MKKRNKKLYCAHCEKRIDDKTHYMFHDQPGDFLCRQCFYDEYARRRAKRAVTWEYTIFTKAFDHEKFPITGKQQ